MKDVIEINNGNSKTISPAPTTGSNFFWSKYLTESVQQDPKIETNISLGIGLSGTPLFNKIKRKKSDK